MAATGTNVFNDNVFREFFAKDNLGIADLANQTSAVSNFFYHCVFTESHFAKPLADAVFSAEAFYLQGPSNDGITKIFSLRMADAR